MRALSPVPSARPLRAPQARRGRWGAWAGLVLLGGCPVTSSERFDDCVVDLEVLTEGAAPGEPAVLGGGPFSATFDTVVRVAGLDADVLDVTREGCATCDTCRDESGCLACGDCPACDAVCDACEETVTFLVPPDVPAGLQPLVLFNAFGGSERAYLLVLDAAETDVPDDTDDDTDSDADDTDDGDTDTDAGDTDAGDTDTDAADTDPGDTDTDLPG